MFVLVLVICMRKVTLDFIIGRRGQPRLQVRANNTVYVLKQEDPEPIALEPTNQCFFRPGDVLYLSKVCL
jgi:hypothetical protein